MSQRSTFLLLFVVLACGSDQRATSRETVAQPSQLSDRTLTPVIGGSDSLPPPASSQDTVIAALLAAGQQFGTTEHEIRQILGEPDSLNATPFQNIHDSTQTDTILRLYYRDLTFGLYRVARDRRDILGEVIFTGTGHPMPFGLGVGGNREQLVTVLGPPRTTLVDDGGLETLEYVGPMEDPTIIHFVLRNDRVQRIEWSYFID